MRPNRSSAACTAASADARLVMSSSTTSRSSASPTAVGHGFGVAAGGDDRVAGGERGLRDVDAHAAACAGDEPTFLSVISFNPFLAAMWRLPLRIH